MRVLRPWPGSTLDASCGHWGAPTRPEPHSSQQQRGTTPPRAVNTPLSATASSQPWTLRITSPTPKQRLTALLDTARIAHDVQVEVFALDALGRIAADAEDRATARALCDAADQLMATADYITEFDRVDARAVRQIA